MLPGPSCPNRPFSMELGDMEINTQIRRVLAPGTDLSLGFGPVPLMERVDGSWVSLSGPPFLDVSMFLHRVSSMLAMPHGGSPYMRMW
jgi:hypothetical protein